MNRHAPKALLLAGCLMLALAACKPNVPVPASSPSAPVESPEETVRTFEGVLNLVDTGLDYLVLVDDDGNFYRFNLNGVSTDDLVPRRSCESQLYRYVECRGWLHHRHPDRVGKDRITCNRTFFPLETSGCFYLRFDSRSPLCHNEGSVQ